MSLIKYATAGERAVATRLVNALIERGHKLTLYNGGDEPEVENSTSAEEILAEMAASGEDELLGDGGVWFYLVYGNAEDGSELICDALANDICQAFYDIAYSTGETA